MIAQGDSSKTVAENLQTLYTYYQNLTDEQKKRSYIFFNTNIIAPVSRVATVGEYMYIVINSSRNIEVTALSLSKAKYLYAEIKSDNAVSYVDQSSSAGYYMELYA